MMLLNRLIYSVCVGNECRRHCLAFSVLLKFDYNAFYLDFRFFSYFLYKTNVDGKNESCSCVAASSFI